MADTSPIKNNLLTFAGSEAFRNALISKNLKPYKTEGSYSYDVKNQNYPIVFGEKVPVDTPNISLDLFENAKAATIVNVYGETTKIDGSDLIAGTGAVSYQQAGTGNVQVLTSEQQVGYSQSVAELELLSEFYIDSAAVVNRYIPQDGYIYSYISTEKILPKKQTGGNEYPNFDFKLDDALGTLPYFDNIFAISIGTGVISSESYLQQISTVFLQDALQERISREIYRNTVGRVNLAAFSDPFQASLLASGQEPLIYKNYSITVPDGVFDQASFLIQRFSGTYIPTSPIEGDYFSEPQRQKGTAGQLIDTTSNPINKPATPLSNPSIKFLNNTGSGQKNVLFNSLGYNRFKPEYEQNTTQIGLAIDNVFDKNNTLTNFYVGDSTNDVSKTTSPSDLVPIDAYGNVTSTIVFGPDEVGKIYEGEQIDQVYNFGLKTTINGPGGVFSDIALKDPTGGFSWVSIKNNQSAGYYPTPGGGIGSQSQSYLQGVGQNFTSSQSTKLKPSADSPETGFRAGSILDETQRIIDSAPASGAKRLVHVGNAMNQLSKVFNDGYKEMTKGSRVMKFVNQNGTQVGVEYGRVFTKDIPYLTYSNLQSTIANTSGLETNGNIRRFTNSIVDSTYNLNIAPLAGQASTNIKDGKVKKYMFSIENLAWRGTAEFESLPDCEKGPNGGRIMWFPPYDITLGSEQSNPKFNSTNFLGRPEPIYTYENTERSSSISWSIIVDHPSVSNLIVKKVLENTDDDTATQVAASFFAGCQKYDIYELAQRYNTLSKTTIEQLYQEILQSNQTTDEEKKEALNEAGDTGGQGTTESPTNLLGDFVNYGFYFPYVFSGTESTTNYTSIYESYYDNRNSYIGGLDSIKMSLFVNNVLPGNYDKMTQLREEIKNILENEQGIIEITLNGSKIPGRADNAIISLAWFDSAVLFFTESVLSNNKTIKSYVDDGKIVFKRQNLGSENTVSGLTTSEGTGNDINCNQPNGSFPQTSFNSAACRAVRISNITVSPNKPTQSSGPETTNDDNIPNPDAKVGLKPEQNQSLQTKLKNVSKKIIRELLTECNYFEVIQQTDKIILDSIKNKFKFFNPAFHAITPEGLNSRLVFLNQCVRPGRTIPTKSEENTEAKITDSFNTNFGTPPVLVLRFGDFYNTKIIPNSLQIAYENMWDFNPEGIGFQPMIAKVTLGFSMIGGHGLARPVEKLQNALSFNYYANTEMYDERADETESTEAVDNALIESLRNEEPLVTVNNVNDTKQNEGGTLVGNIISSQRNDAGIETGTTRYNEFFNGFVDVTKNYFTTIGNTYQTLTNEYNLGVWAQINHDRYYTNGYYDNIFNFQGSTLNILGKQGNWETSLNVIGNFIKTNADNGTDTLIQKVNSALNIDTQTKNKIRENYKSFINDTLINNFTQIAIYIQQITDSQLNFTKYMAKMDLVADSADGKILANGASKLYVLGGTPESGSDTITQFRNDYFQIMTDSVNFYNYGLNKIFLPDSLTSGNTTSYSPIIPFTNSNDNYVYTILSNVIINNSKRKDFFDYLVKDTQSEYKNIARNLIKDFVENNWLFEFTVEKNAEQEFLTDFTTTTEYQSYIKYNPTVEGVSVTTRQRDFTFTTDAPFNAVNYYRRLALENIYKTVNTDNNINIFNGKKQFDN
jgi:hypothetical protein